MPLKSTLTIGHSSLLQGASDGLSIPGDQLEYNKSYAWESGTGANQVDKQYRARLTIAGSATTTLDLVGGVTDKLGAAISFVKIKKLEVYADAANPNTVNVVRPATNGIPIFGAASDLVPVKPGGCLLMAAPDANGLCTCTDTTAQDLAFTNTGAGNVTIDVIIEGTSA